MKKTALALLACLALPLASEARPKPKAAAEPDETATELQAIKGKLIDMKSTASVPQGIISTELSGRDVEFFMKAYEIGGFETWLGEQAKQRGEADKVKAVGDALKSTQAEENELLGNLAKRKGIVLPEVAGKSTARVKAETDLAKVNGPKFDIGVMEAIGVATQQAVDAYTTASVSKDPDIQYFASQLLPMVKEKLALAKRLAGKAAPPGAKPGFRDTSPPPPPPPLNPTPATPAPAAKSATPAPAATPAVKPAASPAKPAPPQPPTPVPFTPPPRK